jgi:hypothetical protein
MPKATVTATVEYFGVPGNKCVESTLTGGATESPNDAVVIIADVSHPDGDGHIAVPIAVSELDSKSTHVGLEAKLSDCTTVVHIGPKGKIAPPTTNAKPETK